MSDPSFQTRLDQAERRIQALEHKLEEASRVETLIQERDGWKQRYQELLAKTEDQNEVRRDGKSVRKDRWETGIRNLVSLLWGCRHEFEVSEVVNRVEELLQEKGLGSAVCSHKYELQTYACKFCKKTQEQGDNPPFAFEQMWEGSRYKEVCDEEAVRVGWEMCIKAHYLAKSSCDCTDGTDADEPADRGFICPHDPEGYIISNAEKAVSNLVKAMDLYPGFYVRSRGPSGCLMAAIEALDSKTAQKIRDDEPLSTLYDPNT